MQITFFFNYNHRKVDKILTISKVNKVKRVKWCGDHKNCYVDQNWKKLCFPMKLKLCKEQIF